MLPATRGRPRADKSAAGDSAAVEDGVLRAKLKLSADGCRLALLRPDGGEASSAGNPMLRWVRQGSVCCTVSDH